MSSKESAKFEIFFWNGGQDGSAYYTKHIAGRTQHFMDRAKDVIGAAIRKSNTSSQPRPSDYNNFT